MRPSRHGYRFPASRGAAVNGIEGRPGPAAFHPAPTVSGVHHASDWCAPYFPFVPNGDKPHSFRSWPMDLSG